MPHQVTQMNRSQLRNLLTRRCDLVVNGRYKIGRKLARGAFGQIRLGRHMVTKEGQSRSRVLQPCYVSHNVIMTQLGS